VDEALKYYQTALKINPNSRETKVNIELLIQDQENKSGEGKGDGKNDGKDKPNQNPNDKPDDKSDHKKDKEKQGVTKGKAPPPKFNSKELTQNDVNKILSEISQQEQKIRGEFNRKEVKEKPHGKDW
jgi:hypothetical protein